MNNQKIKLTKQQKIRLNWLLQRIYEFELEPELAYLRNYGRNGRHRPLTEDESSSVSMSVLSIDIHLKSLFTRVGEFLDVDLEVRQWLKKLERQRELNEIEDAKKTVPIYD